MREIRTSIAISAPAERIWDILMDFKQYPDWNPFIISIRGKAKVRNRLKVTIQPSGSRPMVFKPQVTFLQKEKRFAWLGSLLMRGVFDGHHVFEITSTGEKCDFIHREEFSGFLVPFLWKSFSGPTRKGFEAMNLKLKKLAETH